MNEEQLEQYIIDRGQSKENYFLFYRNQQPEKIDYENVVNNPLNSEHFLKRLHREVRQKERQYYHFDQIQSEEEPEEEIKVKQRKEGEEKKKEYFGQFKRSVNKEKIQQNIKIEDNFDNNVQSGEELAKNILQQYSYIDYDLAKQNFREQKLEDTRLELNLSNPYFFQPKLHTILTR